MSTEAEDTLRAWQSRPCAAKMPHASAWVWPITFGTSRAVGARGSVFEDADSFFGGGPSELTTLMTDRAGTLEPGLGDVLTTSPLPTDDAYVYETWPIRPRPES